jgi:hypothetical protein
MVSERNGQYVTNFRNLPGTIIDDYEKLNQDHVKMLFQCLFLTHHSPKEAEDTK